MPGHSIIVCPACQEKKLDRLKILYGTIARRIGLTEVISMRKGLRNSLPLLLVVAILLGFTAFGAAKDREALPAGSWGLSFRTEGEPPVGNADSAALRQFDAAYVGDTDEKVIYLTFDAGYENGCTAEILDVLKQHGVKAAFFLVGNYLEQNPELVKRMAEEGHTVGNHTYHHWDMSKIGDEATFREELESVEGLYAEITGREMSKYYRPPQGIYSEENLRMAQELGYRTVFWSLAYVDWINEEQPSRETAFSKLLPRIHNGAIVLLHSTSKTNAAILDELLTRWEAQGYRFGTLGDVFG